jgi:hydrogenase 3 maturation protease
MAVVGMGHELRGDDAAGVVAARSLMAALADLDESRQSPASRLLVIDAGPAPENHTGSLRRFQPDLVVLVDAAHMDEAPGAIRWLPWQDSAGLSASTHTLPVHVLARYLTAELGCQVALIGIQPAGTRLGAPLSPEAQAAVACIVNVLDGLRQQADGQVVKEG